MHGLNLLIPDLFYLSNIQSLKKLVLVSYSLFGIKVTSEFEQLEE